MYYISGLEVQDCTYNVQSTSYILQFNKTNIFVWVKKSKKYCNINWREVCSVVEKIFCKFKDSNKLEVCIM